MSNFYSEYGIHLISCNSIVVGRCLLQTEIYEAGGQLQSQNSGQCIFIFQFWSDPSHSYLHFQVLSSHRWLSTRPGTAPSVTATRAPPTRATTSPATAVWEPTRGSPPHSPPCRRTARTRSPWRAMGCRVSPAGPPSPVPTVPSSLTWGRRQLNKVIIISKPTNTR